MPVKRITVVQAAVIAGVRPHVMRAIVKRDYLDTEMRLPRADAGELSSRQTMPQHMIDPADLERLMADKERWEKAVSCAYERAPSAPRQTVPEEQKRAGRVRKRLEDRLEAKRIGVPVEEWGL